MSFINSVARSYSDAVYSILLTDLFADLLPLYSWIVRFKDSARQVAGSFEHGNERSGSVKGGKFLDRLSEY